MNRGNREYTCKKCRQARQVERLQERGMKNRREYNLKAKYNITTDDYNKILESQDFGCKICKTKVPGGRHDNEYFHIDHDHSCCPGKTTCGKCIGGLLCASCNIAIGLMKDDPKVIEAALHYIRATRDPQHALQY